MPRTEVTATFQFIGDQFSHAWYFNRYRCDQIGEGVIVTTALITKGGGTPTVNGFVISRRDLEATKERSARYFEEVSAEFAGQDDAASELLLAPSRVYPVNHINLSRIDQTGELCLYRYSLHTLLNAVKKPERGVGRASPDKILVPCYPVVMFRSEITVQVSLLKDLFAL